jgi:hypothetical protein
MSETSTATPSAANVTDSTSDGGSPTAGDTTTTGPAPTDPAKTLANLKAQRRAKTTTEPAKPAETVTTQTEAPKPTETTTTADKGTATIEMDAADLKRFTTLSREKRELAAKLAESEAKIASFGKFEKATALAKEGKHYDAAREAGIDVDAAIAELLGQNPNSNPTATQIDKKLADRLDALEAKNTESEQKEQARQKAQEAAQLETDRKIANKFVEDNRAKYPFLAKSHKLVKLAFDDYQSARSTLEAEAGKQLSGAEQAKLLMDALSVHEEDWANSLGDKKPDAKTETAGPDGSARAGVTQPAPVAKKKVTFEELKAERMAKRKTA